MNDLRSFFEALAERWDAEQPPDRGEALANLLAPFEGMLRNAYSILEAGTGTGALIAKLQKKAPNARLISIDLAHAMLKRARRRCPAALLVQADVHFLPFPRGIAGSEPFDLIVCHNSFPHFADRLAALGEILRALQRRGHLLILHNLSREQVNAIHRNGEKAIQNDLLPPGRELRRTLVEAGFSDVEVWDTENHYVAIGQRDATLPPAG